MTRSRTLKRYVKTGGCNHVKTVDVIAFLSPR